jgi:hypothetical protein
MVTFCSVSVFPLSIMGGWRDGEEKREMSFDVCGKWLPGVCVSLVYPFFFRYLITIPCDLSQGIRVNPVCIRPSQ